MPRPTRKIKTEEIQNRVFISYSRRDSEFVKRLHSGLAESQVNAWVDWEDIPPSTQWMSEIRRGIDASDAFAFVVSRHSLASDVCREELNHAVSSAKRLIPVVIDEPETSQVPEPLKALNWIFARQDDEFAVALSKFIEAINTDLGKLRAHARLLMRAREWTDRNHDPSFLLRGLDLREAENWLASIDARGPLPSKLHTDYVLESQKFERQEAERWKRLYEQSLARQLAAQSQLLVDQRGTALPLAAALAVEAAHRSPSLETDQALRKALRLMPARIRQHPLPRASVTVVAGEADVMARSYGSTLEIWLLDDAEPGAVIQTEAPLAEMGRSGSPLAITRDGGRVAGIVGGTRVQVWQAADSAVILDYKTETEAFGSTFSADGTKLAVTTEAGTLLLDVATGQSIATLTHESTMSHLSLHPEATEIAVWGLEAVEIWDLTQSKRIASIPINSGGARTELRYSPTGRYLALVSKGTYEINLFDTQTRQRIFEEKRHIDIAFEPQDRGFAIASPEWIIDVHKLPQLERLYRLRHDNSVWRTVFSPDGKRLASQSSDSTIRIWDVESDGREVGRIVESAGSSAANFVFSRDSKRLHLLRENEIETRDRQGISEWVRLECGSPVFSVDASTTGSAVLYGCRNGTWVCMDYANLRKFAESQGRNAFGEQVGTVRIAGRTSGILIRRASGGFELIDLDRREAETEFGAFGASDAATDIHGNIFVLADEGRDLICWSTTDRQVRSRRRWDEGCIAVDVSSSGEAIGVITKNSEVVVLAPSLSEERGRFKARSARGLVFCPAGDRMALWHAEDSESSVWLVSAPDGKLDREWSVPSRINDLRFDPSGTHVGLALKDGSVQVWAVAERAPVAIHRHGTEATTMCFLADAGFVASGSWDGTLRIWPWQQSYLIQAVCARLDRDMTAAEWSQYLPGEPYRKTREAASNRRG